MCLITLAASRRRHVGFVVALVMVVLASVFGCRTAPRSRPGASEGWLDQQVTFPAGAVSVHATYRHRAGGHGSSPAALLIAASGPSDRNSNTPAAPHVDTLRSLAQSLSNDGVASLRYDKIGTGQTGLGSYQGHEATIGLDVYQQEAVAALTFLSNQPDVNHTHVIVIGHSEGALYALLLATSPPAGLPPIHALALLEPLSNRYLDVITRQVDTRLDADLNRGAITNEQAQSIRAALSAAVAQLRNTGTLPADLPASLSAVLPAATATYIAQLDRYDPAELAVRVPAGTPVLISCSDADIQVSCPDVARVRVGLAQAHATITTVRLTGVDHVLKQDNSRTSTTYDDPLPFSTQLPTALHDFLNP
jgi:uncharacterized protein